MRSNGCVPSGAEALKRLEAAGNKHHPRRTAVIQAFFSAERHVTAEELARQLRARGSPVSRTTVYRTLDLLVAHGLATARRFGRGMTRYEPRARESHHVHLICTRCGRIVAFMDEEIERRKATVGRRYGFEIVERNLELYGICARCRATSGGP